MESTTPDAFLLTLFGLGEPSAPEDNRRVSDVRLFAPSWDAARTMEMAQAVREVKDYVVAVGHYGLQSDEMLQEIGLRWPDLGVTHVSVSSDSSRVVIEAC